MSRSPGTYVGGNLLEVRDLSVEFKGGRAKWPVRALSHVSVHVAPGEVVGVLGESGSGKSTLARAILGLVPISSGTVRFADKDITEASYRERRRVSADLQVVFQDPYSSLNPTRTVGQTLGESLRVHQGSTRAEVERRVRSMLERVGLEADAAGRYPSSFSGGQRQRIAIARALMIEPRLVICDEPVSALDLSVQAQVLNLLRELRVELGLSYLFIAHDLDVVRYLSDRVVVLYRGWVMEEGSAEAVCKVPSHPYTRALLEAAPVPDPELQSERRAARRSRAIVPRDPTDVGCPFVARCAYAEDLCEKQRPALEAASDGRSVACHRWRELALAADPPATESSPKGWDDRQRVGS